MSTIGGLDGGEFNINKNDVHLSYLPMAHVFERLVSYAILCFGGQIAMFGGEVLKLKEDMAEVKPTIFVSVPRLYNRFYDLIKA